MTTIGINSPPPEHVILVAPDPCDITNYVLYKRIAGGTKHGVFYTIMTFDEVSKFVQKANMCVCDDDDYDYNE